MTELDAEDAKLVVLARGAMGRAEAESGAAVRDRDGRTYAGAPVALDALPLTALQAAVAAAVSSGATGLEAAVLVGGSVDDAGVGRRTRAVRRRHDHRHGSSRNGAHMSSKLLTDRELGRICDLPAVSAPNERVPFRLRLFRRQAEHG